ncbi:uncharacterized protein LOC144442054 [Glandiceps talaboti]
MIEETTVKYNCKSYTIDQFKSNSDFSINSCSFLHCNIRSLSKNYDDFVAFLNILDHNFLFIALTETWLHPKSNCCLYNLPSYDLITCNRELSQGGGVALYFHTSLSVTRINTSKISHCESVFVEAIMNDKKIIISVIYRKPNTPFNEFIVSLEACLDQMFAKGNDCIILGDMNIDTSSDVPSIIHYNTLLNTYNLTQIIDTPTRVTDTSNTVIDHLITNITDYFIESGVIETDITDHFPIFGVVKNIHHVFKPDTKTQTYDFRHYDKDTFLADLSDVSWQSVYDCHDASEAYTTFYNLFHNVIKRHLRLKKGTKSPKSIKRPWITKGILKSINTKHKIFSKMKNNSSNDKLKSKYKTYRNILTKLLRSAKKRYYANKVRHANGDTNKTWQIIKEILNKTPTKLPPDKIITNNPDNTCLTDCTDIADEFNKYFTSIGPNLAAKITHNIDFNQYLKGNYPNSFFFHPVNKDDILLEISKLNSRKATGQDMINPQLVKHSADIIALPLTHIVNCSLSHGICPNELKIAKVIPIYKKGSPTDVGNYRPISVLPILSKVMESIVNNQLINYLDKYDILIRTQFGFRKKHSTKLALTDLVTGIADKLDKGYLTFGIFIDLRKAFDTINHNILIEKLNHYGIRGKSAIGVMQICSQSTQIRRIL